MFHVTSNPRSVWGRAGLTALVGTWLLLILTGAASATDYYVKTPANGGSNANDGLSWTQAKATISAAMSLVDGSDRILVAAGTYNEKVTFHGSNNNELLGGYPAAGEGTRAPWTNLTILDGATAATTGPMIAVPYNSSGSGYGGIVIDGFTVRNGTNTSQYGVGGIQSWALGITIRNCIVENNTATNNSFAGGMHLSCGHLDSRSPVIETCIIRNNTGSGVGGINVEGAGAKSYNYTATMRNTLIYGNKSTASGSWGTGAIDVFYPGGVSAVNCTIADNLTQGNPTHKTPGIRISGYDEYQQGIVTAKNCIIWHPTGDDIYITQGTYGPEGAIAMTYSDVNDPGDATGTGVISANPLFAAASDYHLTGCSPCVDKGTASGAPGTDLDGNARPQHGLFDMGAYEYAGSFEDSDGDGVIDACDACPGTPACANPVDASGCPRDSDGDGIVDGCDQCPSTPSGDAVDADGCSTVDSDGDGVTNDKDTCPGTPACARPVDANGCPSDGDGDGVPDGCDLCPSTSAGEAVDADGCSTVDSDGDGVPNDKDTCPGTPACARPVDANGCPSDSDGDGVMDGCDLCPGTSAGEAVDASGCSTVDSDGDGVPNDKDTCPGTPTCARPVDANGCPSDGDGDGVMDGCDLCPNTPAGDAVDANGCSTVDSDADGVPNDKDTCPNTPACARPVDANGCPSDGDGDGVSDGCDLCPNTPAGDAVDASGCSTVDSDADGVPNDKDTCPNTPACARPVDANGCPSDGDGDGVPDGCDLCPNTPAGDAVDASGCSTVDSDGDGVPNDKDTCPDTPAGDAVDANGCSLPDEEPAGRELAGTGTADANGAFLGQAKDENGAVLAEVNVTGAPSEATFAYELTDSDGLAGAPGPGSGTFAGFADGVALGRTLTVTTSAAAGTFQVLVSITFTAAELANRGINPATVEIHVLNEATNTWEPAGTNLGESQPTGIVGQSGYYNGTDGRTTFWTIRDELSHFAVGAAVPADSTDVDNAQETPAPLPWFTRLFCGAGVVQAAVATLLGLMLMPTHRRRR